MKNTRLLSRTLVASTLLALGACASTQLTSAPEVPPTFLLMGEVHDNPHGHQQRYEDLKKLVDAGWRPAIALEQFDRERQDDLDRAAAQCKEAQCVIDQAGGARWDWKLYYPVINMALEHKLPLVAANLSRKDAGNIMRQGFAAALPADLIASYQLPASISQALVDGQKDAINQGHCGKAPESMLGGFANAQIARDIVMAKAMMDNAKTGVVLLAGNGHVRNDLGAVYWLRAQGMTSIRSVAYLESAPPADKAAFDVSKVVQRHERPDPCAKLNMPAK